MAFKELSLQNHDFQVEAIGRRLSKTRFVPFVVDSTLLRFPKLLWDLNTFEGF